MRAGRASILNCDCNLTTTAMGSLESFGSEVCRELDGIEPDCKVNSEDRRVDEFNNLATRLPAHDLLENDWRHE